VHTQPWSTYEYACAVFCVSRCARAGGVFSRTRRGNDSEGRDGGTERRQRETARRKETGRSGKEGLSAEGGGESEATYLHSENKGCGPRCVPFVPRNEEPRESIRRLFSLLLDLFLAGSQQPRRGDEARARARDARVNFLRFGTTRERDISLTSATLLADS